MNDKKKKNMSKALLAISTIFTVGVSGSKETGIYVREKVSPSKHTSYPRIDGRRALL